MTDIIWANETRRLSDLIPWEHNPKQLTTKQGEHLTTSLDHFGQVLPFAISPDNEIYDGHQRRALMERMNEYGADAVVDVRVSSRPLTDDERRELVIRLRENQADWDFDLLGNLYDVDELTEWGFPEWRLAEFAGDDDEPMGDTEPQIDKAEELRQKWQVETGQLWELGEHRLICGDCTDAAVVERVMAGEKAQAVVTDPPYGINVDTSWLSALNVKRGTPANASDDRLQNDDGTLDLSWVYQYPKWLVFGFPYVARVEAFTGLLVWDKRGDGGENGLGSPVEVAASNAFTGYRLCRHLWAGWAREAGEHRYQHPTQKPVGIMVDAIQLAKADLIFDPFLGSGTTLIACENLGRRCRAVEISPLGRPHGQDAGACGVMWIPLVILNSPCHR